MSRVYLEELDRQRARLNNGGMQCVEAFFQEDPGVNNMLRWMDQRNLRELQIAQAMSAAFMKMGPDIPRDIFVAIGKFIHDEVRHFRDFTRVIGKLRAEYGETGGPVAQLPEEKNWHAVTLENLKKHFLAVFSGSYVGESVALAVNDILIEGCRKFGYNKVADLYTGIGRDEVFHVNLNRLVIEKYSTTKETQDIVIEVATKKADRQIPAWESLYRVDPA